MKTVYDLRIRLADFHQARPIVARTPHGTYTFDIVSVKVGGTDTTGTSPLVLNLVERPGAEKLRGLIVQAIETDQSIEYIDGLLRQWARAAEMEDGK